MAAPRNTFAGILLIFIGLAFLIGQLSDVEYSWTFILMGLGLAFLLRNVIERRSVSIFPGVLLFLLGLAFFADDMGWEMLGVWDAWPFIPGIVGIAFLAEYLFASPRKGGVLLTSLILIGVGTLFVAAESRHLDWNTVGQILEWWPVVLLIIGVWLLVKKPERDRARKLADNEHAASSINPSDPDNPRPQG